MFRLACITLSLSSILSACAVSPENASDKALSSKLLNAQIQQAIQKLEASKEPRLVYVGAALHDTSKAFRGDIDLVEQRLKEVDAGAVVIKLSNPPASISMDLPFALQKNLDLVAKEVFPHLQNDDKVVVLLSTHGLPEIAFAHAGGKNYPPITPKYLSSQFLAGLEDKPLMLFISACYAGSFIESLRHNGRIIMTAAAKDRNSFGCNFSGKQTFFIDGVFGDNWSLQKSMLQIFGDAKISIDKREKYFKTPTASLPQLDVGSKLQTWMETPVKNWLNP